MNIGEAGNRSGLPTKTIRYYESIGLVSSTRRPNGFRDYGEEAVRKLHFIGVARSLGFSVEECRELIDLFEDSTRTAAQSASLVGAQIDAIHGKIDMLRALETALLARSGDAGAVSVPLLEAGT